LAHGHEQLVEGQASGHIVKPQAYPLLDRENPNPEDSANSSAIEITLAVGAWAL
jgi:hypothetical protein